MADEIKIFNQDAHDVILPTAVEVSKEVEKLIATDITEAISGDTVKSMLLDTLVGVQQPNYTFILKDGSIKEVQLRALEALVSKEGNTALYLLKNKDLRLIGFGNLDELGRTIPSVVRKILFDDIEVVYNFGGDVAYKVNSKNNRILRLKI